MKKKMLEYNLSCLAEQNQELAAQIEQAAEPDGALVKPAKSGDLTLIINGISMHSRFDPVREGEKLAKSPLARLAQTQGQRLAVFGLGLGYHICSLAKKLDEIWIIEPCPGLIRLAFSYLDFSAIMTKLHFVSHYPPEAGWPPTILLPHPPSKRLDPENYALWAQFLGNTKENETTAETLKKTCAELVGMREIIDELNPEKRISLKDLAQHIENREGALSEAEIMILLLHELSRVPGEKHA